MWEQNDLVVTVFRRGGLPLAPSTPSYTLVSAKWFQCDAQHDTLGEIASVGLIQPSVNTRGIISDATVVCSVLSMIWQGVHLTKQQLNICSLSLQMYLKNWGSLLQLV